MTTRLDQGVVDTQAQKYDDAREHLSNRLNAAREQAKGLASTSGSAATRALDMVIDRWVDETKRTLLDEDMADIARIIRHAKDDQISADETNAKQINNLMEATSSFLGG